MRGDERRGPGARSREGVMSGVQEAYTGERVKKGPETVAPAIRRVVTR